MKATRSLSAIVALLSGCDAEHVVGHDDPIIVKLAEEFTTVVASASVRSCVCFEQYAYASAEACLEATDALLPSPEESACVEAFLVEFVSEARPIVACINGAYSGFEACVSVMTECDDALFQICVDAFSSGLDACGEFSEEALEAVEACE